MLISIIFVFTLSCTFSSHTSAGIVNSTCKENDDSADNTRQHTDADKQMALSTVAASSAATISETVLLFDSKLEAFTAALNRIDGSVQDLHEKSHSWAILRHHIDAWNDQMKVHEHKMELLRRSQDEQSNKLMSFELILNHILSKVIYLSDGCPSQPSAESSSHTTAQQSQQFVNAPKQPQPQSQTPPPTPIAQLQSDNRLQQVQAEMSSRLNNILRHLQNIEKKQFVCRIATDAGTTAGSNVAPATSQSTSATASSPSPSSKAPVGIQSAEAAATGTATTTTPAAAAAANLPIKEIKQLHSLAKKNAKLLEHIMQEVAGTDVRCDGMARNVNRRIDSISGELATFTGSSDLLLKRIESLLRVLAYKADKPTTATKANEFDGDEAIENSAPNDEDQAGMEEQEEVEEDSEQDNEVALVEDVNSVDVEANVVYELNSEDSTKMPMFLRPEQRHCHELNRDEAKNGIYVFATPQFSAAKRVNMRLCVFGNAAEDDAAAWTVIQNRGAYEVQENFNRSWSEYRDGFGSLHRDFWYGNELVHQLLQDDDYVLRIELTDDQATYGWAEYNTFRLDSEDYNYNLMIGGFSSDSLPDALQYNNEQDFSTYDRRNDKSVDACCPCAVTYASGWWFERCSEANLNGIYRHKAMGHNHLGIIWQDWPHEDYSLRTARMMIRPRSVTQSIEDP